MRSFLVSVLAVVTVTALVLGVCSITIMPASAQGKSQDPGKNWRVYNVEPDTNFFWDINKPQALAGGVLQFPIQPFQSTTTGSFVVYLYNNYNADITGKTFVMNATWTAGTYATRSSFPGAFVRFEFQDVASGTYSQNDYWWSTGTGLDNSLDLNTLSGGSLTVPLTDRSRWSNLCGRLATDTDTGYNDCITGGVVTVSAFDGFTNAMKNVKMIGLGFGNSARYASGVAINASTAGAFQLLGFTIQ
jgi:Tfp pilus assembly protein FimT